MPFFIPGAIPVNTAPHEHFHGKGKYTYSYENIRPGPEMGYLDTRAKGASAAFMEYTFAGPIELMAGKSAAQAGILSVAGVYGSFQVGLAIELGVDFAILGSILTIADPANKWGGGLDEWGFLGGNQQGVSLPGTTSAEEGSTFMWGLKQGHLGFLYGLAGGTN